jgi:predicted HAD superfamily hydrolase
MVQDHLDSRLKAAYDLVETGHIKVLSLDIFDTLLWRQVPHYEDIFLLLGKQFLKDKRLISAVTAESFADLRKHAEQKARQIKSVPPHLAEVTLPEIYWQLKPIFKQLSLEQMLLGEGEGIYGDDVSALVRTEFELEKKLIHFNPAIVQLALFAEQKKVPVVLVSDTYFEENHILQFLAKEPRLNFHQLFLSCEYGCSKQGGLFKIVLQKLNVRRESILHIGDNLKSDIKAASCLGIKTLHFSKYDPDFEDILRREWSTDLSNRTPLLDDKEGDFGLTSLRCQMGYHSHLQSLKLEERFYWKYGAQVLGPILWGFIHWVYERCHSMGQNKVFCLMREGKLYAELIQRYAPYYPGHQLEATPLWVSRVFMSHAAITDGGGRELTALMKVFIEKANVETFLKCLGLDVDQMGKWKEKRHMLLEDKRLKKSLIKSLQDPSLKRQIIQYALLKRQRFFKYLSTCVQIQSPNQMTLVDVGWKGTTQGALQHMLHLINSPATVNGLYLGTLNTFRDGIQDGSIREGFLFRGGHPKTTRAYQKGLFVLEQTATAETGVGPLADIDENGNIVTHPMWFTPQQQHQASLVQKGIFAFFDRIGPYLKSGEIMYQPNTEMLPNQLRSLLVRSMTSTTRREAKKFGPWKHEHSSVEYSTESIGKNKYYDQFIKDMLPSEVFKAHGLNWLSAYTAKKSKYLTLATQAVLLNTLHPRCFLSEDHYAFSIFLDTGKNFPEKPHTQVKLRSNPNRHFYSLTKLFSTQKPIKRIQLTLSFPLSLVRIKSLRMAVFDKSGPEPTHLTFFEKTERSSEIACLSGKQMDQNTFFCEGPLQLMYAFKPSQIYHIRMSLCCEMFRF